LLWDTGATLSVTPYMEDFISPLITTDQPKIMKGIAKGLQIQGIGTVKYQLLDDNGESYTITTQAYYTPDAKRRIFSPQAYFQDLGSKATTMQNKDSIKLQVGKQVVTILYNELNNLPTLKLSNYGKACEKEHSKQNFNIETSLCVTDSENQNLTGAQKELLRFHFHLGHINMACIQLALKSGSRRIKYNKGCFKM
jgi:hypothetical protein